MREIRKNSISKLRNKKQISTRTIKALIVFLVTLFIFYLLYLITLIWPDDIEDKGVSIYFKTYEPESSIREEGISAANDRYLDDKFYNSLIDIKKISSDSRNPTPQNSSNNSSFLNLTILRSALYQFVLNEGYFPMDLNQLTKDFPDNYLSSIPDNQNSNEIVKMIDNTGGWYYNPPKNTPHTTNTLINKVKESLKPNTKSTPIKKPPFNPIEIIISKDAHSLYLKSGPIVLNKFSIGLGKNNLTPSGEFYINKRVAFPNYHLPTSNHPFGTRGMELSNSKYAIHGTFNNNSINRNLSAGCIRLTNTSIETLFIQAPLYTPVIIQESTPKVKYSLKLSDRDESNAPPTPKEKEKEKSNTPTISDDQTKEGEKEKEKTTTKNCDECDSSTIYHWSG